MSKLKKSKEIKAVLFDLGKVILQFDFQPAFHRLSKACPFGPKEISRYFTDSGLEVLYDGGKISSIDFHKEVKKSLRHSLSFSEFKKTWNDIFTLNAEIAALIKALHGNYRLVLISNTNAMHFDYAWAKYPVLKHFDELILSYKERVRKPDERIYKKAALACRATPQEIFYIDDREDLTSVAKELGFHTFTYKNNPKTLISKMKEQKIVIP